MIGQYPINTYQYNIHITFRIINLFHRNWALKICYVTPSQNVSDLQSMKFFYILLIFTQLFSCISVSYAPFREHDQSIRKAIDFDDSTTTPNREQCCGCRKDCYCLLNCNKTLPKPKKIINPFKYQLEQKVPQKPFGSLCVKCAACLAVASEIQNVIESASQECETDMENKKVLLQEIDEKINRLCKRGFTNFDLRSYGNHKIITNNFECTKHVTSSMDGSWTKKLRDICSLYISRADTKTISLTVLDSMGNLTDIFCRGTGIFRDCSNIKSHENIVLPTCNTLKCHCSNWIMS
ncbi:unnamed protein product [Ceutorhynchus assimilis]|uniref:Uncharacterized protein n=1 Tax=Ceutorhynchus assimilis TaxID=467358 RepID=A0A9P0DV73_9CUCU|nr:unnamed protein product [Ceutorhynchus assimilis]